MAECVFQVLIGIDGFARLIDQLEREVSQRPNKGRENLGVVIVDDSGLAFLLLALQMNVLGDVQYERKVLNRTFVDSPHRVVNKAGTKKNG